MVYDDEQDEDEEQEADANTTLVCFCKKKGKDGILLSLTESCQEVSQRSGTLSCLLKKVHLFAGDDLQIHQASLHHH